MKIKKSRPLNIDQRLITEKISDICRPDKYENKLR
ncbi:hypothetical protein QOZ91_001762 [Clostridium sardiniense]|nr:hypothetical protein [Clostridium sardiniense]